MHPAGSRRAFDTLEQDRHQEHGESLPGQLRVGISPHIDLAMWAQRGGLSMNDVEVVVMAFPDMVPAMANKALDGALLIEPFRTQVLEQGIGAFIESADKVYPEPPG